MMTKFTAEQCREKFQCFQQAFGGPACSSSDVSKVETDLVLTGSSGTRRWEVFLMVILSKEQDYVLLSVIGCIYSTREKALPTWSC